METRDIKNKSDELKNEIRKEVSKELSQWEKTAAQKYQQAKVKAAEVKEKSEKYICENPGKSVTAAAALGVAIGAAVTGLIRRRNK